jgi:hypothetical protein
MPVPPTIEAVRDTVLDFFRRANLTGTEVTMEGTDLLVKVRLPDGLTYATGPGAAADGREMLVRARTFAPYRVTEDLIYLMMERHLVDVFSVGREPEGEGFGWVVWHLRAHRLLACHSCRGPRAAVRGDPRTQIYV